MKTLIDFLKPYRVYVGAYTHATWTFAGALEWVACYPPSWGQACICARRGKRLVAIRA